MKTNKIEKKEECPHCNSILIYNDTIENDGDRYKPILMCNNQFCNTHYNFPYYFKYTE
jgi:RNase P subunit RPR2